MNARYAALKGLRVFIVEDEFAVLLLIEDMVEQLGCELVGSASRLGEALDMTRDRAIDVAVLDVNLRGQLVYPVAERLAARSVSIVFSTGYGDANVGERWRSYPIVQKPYLLDELAAALMTSVKQKQTRTPAR